MFSMDLSPAAAPEQAGGKGCGGSPNMCTRVAHCKGAPCTFHIISQSFQWYFVCFVNLCMCVGLLCQCVRVFNVNQLCSTAEKESVRDRGDRKAPELPRNWTCQDIASV